MSFPRSNAAQGSPAVPISVLVHSEPMVKSATDCSHLTSRGIPVLAVISPQSGGMGGIVHLLCFSIFPSFLARMNLIRSTAFGGWEVGFSLHHSERKASLIYTSSSKASTRPTVPHISLPRVSYFVSHPAASAFILSTQTTLWTVNHPVFYAPLECNRSPSCRITRISPLKKWDSTTKECQPIGL